jgi:hypothetical protein
MLNISNKAYSALSDEYEKWMELYEKDRQSSSEIDLAFDSLFEIVGMVINDGIVEVDEDSELELDDALLERQEMEDFAHDHDFSDYELTDF